MKQLVQKLDNRLTAALPVLVFALFVLQPLMDILSFWVTELGKSNTLTLLLRMGVLALMCKALYSMYRQCPKGALAYGVMAGAVVLVAFTDISVLLVIIGCAVTGLVASMLAKGGKRA